MLTFSPEFLSKEAMLAAAMPLPSELKTPPVMKIYFVCFIILSFLVFCEFFAKFIKIHTLACHFKLT